MGTDENGGAAGTDEIGAAGGTRVEVTWGWLTGRIRGQGWAVAGDSPVTSHTGTYPRSRILAPAQSQGRHCHCSSESQTERDRTVSEGGRAPGRRFTVGVCLASSLVCEY